MTTKHEKLRAMLSTQQRAQLDQVMAALEEDPQALEHHKEVKSEKRIQNSKDWKLPPESRNDGDEGVQHPQYDRDKEYKRACAFAEEALRQANGTQVTKKG
jgi:hypothetical protein